MFERFSIAARLWIPTVCMSATLVVMGAALALRTSTLARESNQQQHQQQEKLELSLAWAGLTSTNAARTVAILASSDMSLEAQMAPDVKATTARISEMATQLEALPMDPGEREALAQVGTQRKAYIAARDLARQQKAGGDASAAAASLADKVRPALQRYLDAQTRFVKVQQAHSDALREQVTEQRMRSVWGAVAAMVLMIALLTGTTLSAVRTIRQPLRGLVSVAERIGQGDLSVELDLRRHDEVGELERALANMRDSLRGIVGQVRDSAASIQVASSEVAAGNRLDGAADRPRAPQRAVGRAGRPAGRVRQRGGAARWPGGGAGGQHHERDPGQLAQDQRHHRHHRRHCLPDQHPGLERRGGSRARR
jgi:HAMP domain-containing protein